jgi:hypothetical protein
MVKRKPRRKPAEHPMQPVVIDRHGVARFKRNMIVNYLVNWCAGHNGLMGYPRIDGPAPDLNQIALMTAQGEFSREDAEQLTQLIGYSVSGAPNLRRRVQAAADADVERLIRQRRKK